MKNYILIGIFAILLTSGCDASKDSADTSTVSLSFATSTQSNTLAPKSNGHIQFTSVKLLVREIKFHARSTDSESDSLDFQTETLVVNLRTDTLVTELTVATVPVGVYHKVSFRIHKPEGQEVPPDPDFKIGASGLPLVASRPVPSAHVAVMFSRETVVFLAIVPERFEKSTNSLLDTMNKRLTPTITKARRIHFF